jgi:hypothetical protein
MARVWVFWRVSWRYCFMSGRGPIPAALGGRVGYAIDLANVIALAG